MNENSSKADIKEEKGAKQSAQAKKKGIWSRTWLHIIFLFFLFPVGAILLWFKSSMRFPIKIFLTLLFGVIFIAVLFTDPQTSDAPEIAAVSPTPAEPETISLAKVNPSPVMEVPAFSMPTGLTSIVESIEAERLDDGGIAFVGKIHLPKGTEFKLTLRKSGNDAIQGQANFNLTNGGKFLTVPFTNKGEPHKAGNYRVELLAHFNAAWKQPPDTMKVVGKKGLALPENLSIPNDKEFPEQGRYIEVNENVRFPRLTPKYVALHAVKNARLTLPDQGKSAETVESVVNFFHNNCTQFPSVFKGCKVFGWHADEDENGAWIVTLKYQDSGKPTEAKWQYSPKTRAVKYIDYNAKLLSWSPAE